MAKAQVKGEAGFGAAAILGKQSVFAQIKQADDGSSSWSDAWRTIKYLTPLSAMTAIAPTKSHATFRFDYGVILREGETSFAAETPADLTDTFVRIRKTDTNGTSTLWTGIITDEQFDTDATTASSVDGNASGSQMLIAFGLEQVLDSITISTAVARDADNNLQDLDHVPPFNQRLPRGRQILGNRSDTSLATFDPTVYPFGSDNSEWSNRDIAAYLLYEFTELPFTFSGQYDILNSIIETHRFEGWTIYQALNQLIQRRRGIGWTVRVDEDDDINIHVFSAFARPISLAGAQQPGNAEQIELTLDKAINIRRALVKTETRTQYHEVRVFGARIKSCFTVSFADGNLERAWTANEETAYKTGIGSASNLAQANDAYRTTDLVKRVYTTYRIPNNWDGSAGNGLGGGGDTAVPYANSDGTIATDIAGDLWNSNAPLLRWLPILSDAEATNSQPEYLPPIVIVPDTDRDRYVLVDGSDGYGRAPARVRMLDGELAFEIRSSPNHLYAKNHWSGANPTNTAKPVYDWEDIIATVAIETDQRLKVVERTREYDSTDHPRSLTIYVPDAELWYAPSGTVTGVTVEGKLQYLGGGGTLRDDGQRLRDIAALAIGWYGQPRSQISLRLSTIEMGVPGIFIIDISASKQRESVGAVLSSVEWDFRTFDTILRTGYWEVDFVAMTNVTPHQSPDLRALERKMSDMQTQLDDVNTTIGRIPARDVGPQSQWNLPREGHITGVQEDGGNWDHRYKCVSFDGMLEITTFTAPQNPRQTDVILTVATASTGTGPEWDTLGDTCLLWVENGVTVFWLFGERPIYAEAPAGP